MSAFCMIMFFLCFLGIFVFIVWFVIRLIKRLLKRTDKHAPRLLLGSAACFILAIVFALMAPDTDYSSVEDEVASVDDGISAEPEVVEEEVSAEPEATEKEEYFDTETAETETKPEEINIDDLSEDNYKALCQEVSFDDLFYGDTDLYGEQVKLDLFFESEITYSVMDMNYTFIDDLFHGDIKLNKDYWVCEVYNPEYDSYVGKEQVFLLFSVESGLEADGYVTGSNSAPKYIVYGEVVYYPMSSKESRYYCVVIPRYIDKK